MTDIATPADVRDAAVRKRPIVLSALVAGKLDEFFPMTVRVKLRPGGPDKPTLQTFAASVHTLIAGSKRFGGRGYTVETVRRRSRDYGEQEFPHRIVVESLEDYRAVTRLGPTIDRTGAVADAVRASLPTLEGWLIDNATRLERYADDVDDLIAVCRRLVERPMPDCYLRELDVPVDTKFVERHDAVLRQWLDLLLPADAIDVNERRFARRYGLRDGRPHHLIRVLDPDLVERLRLPGEELSLPMRTLAGLPVDSVDVIIVENRTTLLTLPSRENTIALGGVGDSVTRLRDVPWIGRGGAVFYWGDLDVDGFRILAGFRRLFPRVVAVMMDRETFRRHRHRSVPGNGRSADEQPTLGDDENDLLRSLAEENLRVEQESLDPAFVRLRIATMGGGTP